MTTESGSTLQAAAIERRYADAYLVANAINGVGNQVKTLALAFGSALSLFALMFGTNGFGGFFFAVILAVSALTIGAILYLFGILVAAQGQILKASVDSAVNSSPFITNDIRARIMSLPTTGSSSGSSGAGAGGEGRDKHFF